MVRLFIAVNLPDDLRGKLVSVQEQLPRHGLKLVEPENLHLTLKFLGEVSEDAVSEVGCAMTEAVADQASFEVEVAGLGAFPDLRRPRVVWAGVTRGRQDVVSLQTRLEDALQSLGFQREKDFHPHVTLARVKLPAAARTIAEVVRGAKSAVFGSFAVREVDLMKSTLTLKGPVYEKVLSARLRQTSS
jgi:2'-5' RNA ligase